MSAMNPPHRPKHEGGASFRNSLQASPCSIFVHSFRVGGVTTKERVVMDNRVTLNICCSFFVIVTFRAMNMRVLLQFRVVRGEGLGNGVVVPVDGNSLVHVVRIF